MINKNVCPKCSGNIRISVQVFDTWSMTEDGRKYELINTEPTDNYGHYCDSCNIDEDDILAYIKGK
jgi:hypothetical protein